MLRAVRAVGVPRAVRAIGVAVRDFVGTRAVVVGFVVRAVTDCVDVRDAAVVRGVMVVVVVRAATFLVVVRGSVGAVVALRAFVAPERDVFVLFDFCD